VDRSINRPSSKYGPVPFSAPQTVELESRFNTRTDRVPNWRGDCSTAGHRRRRQREEGDARFAGKGRGVRLIL
jgi:hypothetical protein